MKLLPPNPQDAERSAIGAVFLRPEAFDVAELEAEDFYDPRYREIWRSLGRIRAAHKPVDLVVLEEDLQRTGTLKGLGDLSCLSECMTAVPTADNVQEYAHIIREAKLTRDIYVALSEVLGSELQGEDLLQRAWATVSGLGVRQKDRSTIMRDLVIRTFKTLGQMADRKQQGEAPVLGVPTGYVQLDHTLGGGLPFGVVSVLGGRPSTGKSALALALADHATSAGYPTHVFSLEDQAEPYGMRALARQSHVAHRKLRTIDLDREDFSRLMEAVETLGRPNWLLDDSAGLSSAQIAMRVRKHRRELGTRFVIVDYLQLITEQGCKDLRQEIEKAMKGLVALARDEGIALLVLSQLSRDNEREKRRPTLRDLRESGAIEQHASVVLFTHHEPIGDSGDVQGEVIVAKQKQGDRFCIVQLYWDKKAATYRDPERSYA